MVGAHLAGQPLNHQLTDRGARAQHPHDHRGGVPPLRTATTPPKPGLVRTPADGAAIEVEVWAIDAAGLGEFVAAIPAPLGVGKVLLADGTEVHRLPVRAARDRRRARHHRVRGLAYLPPPAGRANLKR